MINKCVVCGASLSGNQINAYLVDLKNQRVPTCGDAHQREAQAHPEKYLQVIDSGY